MEETAKLLEMSVKKVKQLADKTSNINDWLDYTRTSQKSWNDFITIKHEFTEYKLQVK